MKSLKEESICRDLIRQGKILLDGNWLNKADLYTDKLLMLSDNECWSDKVYCDTYYKYETEISETLMNFRGQQ